MQEFASPGGHTLRDRRSSVRYGHHSRQWAPALYGQEQQQAAPAQPAAPLCRSHRRPGLGVPIHGPRASRAGRTRRPSSRPSRRSSRSSCPRSRIATPSSSTDLLDAPRVAIRLGDRRPIPRCSASASGTRAIRHISTASSTRGELYLFHIVEALEARGMPAELALLPIVESAFDPFAYSHGRAAGLVADHPRHRQAARARAELVVRRPPRRARVDARRARLPRAAARSSSTAIGCSRSPVTTPAKATSPAR